MVWMNAGYRCVTHEVFGATYSMPRRNPAPSNARAIWRNRAACNLKFARYVKSLLPGLTHVVTLRTPARAIPRA